MGLRSPLGNKAGSDDNNSPGLNLDIEFRFRRPPTRQEIVAEDPLGEFFVWWDDITQSDVDLLKRCLEGATRERQLQRYLENHPLMLIQYLGGGHGRWVIPQKKLGSEYVTDFVIGEENSDGFRWTAVELEMPTARMFTKAGDPTAPLNHAVRQIEDWRAWLQRNQNYASRSRTENGLGLTDIDVRLLA